KRPRVKRSTRSASARPSRVRAEAWAKRASTETVERCRKDDITKPRGLLPAPGHHRGEQGTRVLGAFALGHVQLFEREPGAFVAAEELAVAPAHRRLHEVHLGTPEAHLGAEQAGHGFGGVAPGDRDAGVQALGAAASRVDPRAA